MAPTVRLDKLLANLGYGSRREIEQMARAGQRQVPQSAQRCSLSSPARTPSQ